MRKLLSVFLIMLIVSCGTTYASDYGVNGDEKVIENSGLEGKHYLVFVFLLAGCIPLASPVGFSFDELGNFYIFPLNRIFTDYSGPYTQTGTTFSAHCEYKSLNIPHEFDYEGTISGIFIHGNFTGQGVIGDEIVIPGKGFFFGFYLF